MGLMKRVMFASAHGTRHDGSHLASGLPEDKIHMLRWQGGEMERRWVLDDEGRFSGGGK